jgi:hypothetical protein
MNGAIHSAASKERPVGGIDDSIDVERGDVRHAHVEPCLIADLGGAKGYRGSRHC